MADLCTGSGIVALESAALGARSVLAVDACPRAVAAARARCLHAPCPVVVEHTDLAAMAGRDRFDLITCNPPYVPTPPYAVDAVTHATIHAPRSSWAAGTDGRRVLDELCELASDLLVDGGTLMLVQSDLSDVAATIRALDTTGLVARVAARRTVPFGPVLDAHAEWLEVSGRIAPDCRTEGLSVIRADKVA